MVPRLLVWVALGQGLAMVLTVAGLLITHRIALRRDRRRFVELDRARSVIRRTLSHQMLQEEARVALDALHSRTLDAFLHEFAGRRSGEDREMVFQLLSGTCWHAGLGQQARSRLWWRRLRSARAITALAKPSHLPLVHELLGDPAPAVRLVAATALERLPSPGLASAMLERAIASHGAERNHLIEILADSDTLVLPVMTQRLAQPADDEALGVLLTLTGRLGFTSLLAYIVPHASSESVEVRIATANCLRNFPHPQTSNALRRLLTDRSWEVRARAAASLGPIGAIEAIDDLVFALRDPNWWVRLRSAISLRLIGPYGVEALRSLPPGEDRFAADMAGYILDLDDGAMAEYVGGAANDFSTASAPALAS